MTLFPLHMLWWGAFTFNLLFATLQGVLKLANERLVTHPHTPEFPRSPGPPSCCPPAEISQNQRYGYRPEAEHWSTECSEAKESNIKITIYPSTVEFIQSYTHLGTLMLIIAFIFNQMLNVKMFNSKLLQP